MLSDAGNTLFKINQAGTQGGGPTKVVTIRSIRVVPAPVSSTSTSSTTASKP
jgi:hypothetical protein